MISILFLFKSFNNFILVFEIQKKNKTNNNVSVLLKFICFNFVLILKSLKFYLKNSLFLNLQGLSK